MDSTREQISDALKSVFGKIEEKFGARLLGSSVFRRELTFLVAAEDLIEVATYCKEGLGFDRLEFLTGNHFPERFEQPFEVAVQLTSMATNDRLRLKVPLKEGQKSAYPELPLACGKLVRARDLGDVRDRVRGAPKPDSAFDGRGLRGPSIA